jgi:hypothetical protein
MLRPVIPMHLHLHLLAAALALKGWGAGCGNLRAALKPSIRWVIRASQGVVLRHCTSVFSHGARCNQCGV